MALRACMLAGVFFGDYAVAMRKASSLQSGASQADRVLGAEEPAESPILASYHRAHRDDEPPTEEQERISEINCDEMPVAFAAALVEAKNTLSRSCKDDHCNLAVWTGQRTIDELDEAAASIHDHFVAADRKECLAETLADDGVRERAADLRRLWEQMLAGASTRRPHLTFSVRERLEQSLALMGVWRGSMLAQAGTTIDRRLVFPRNVEDSVSCPDPCVSCSRHHNSIFEGEERLAFKCILPRHGSAPSSPDLSCDEPQQRSGLGGTIHGQTKTWCDVRSWRVAAEQSVGIAVNVACGAEMIFGPLRHGQEMEERVRETCLAVERGDSVVALALQAFDEYKTVVDNVVADGELSAFRIFLELGMAEGLADLRQAARGNTA